MPLTSSWKANASTQEYKSTHIITTEGVDLENLDNFNYFCTQNTEKMRVSRFFTN